VEEDDPLPELLSLFAQESNRPTANAKIVGRNRNFSFIIEPKFVPDT
jgi:hypothetical protein